MKTVRLLLSAVLALGFMAGCGAFIDAWSADEPDLLYDLDRQEQP